LNNRLKIAVNTRFLIKDKLEGIGLFTYESLKRIVVSHPEIDFCFLFDRSYDAEFVFAKNVTPVVLFPQARHPFLWYWWFEISVSRWLKKNKPALFLSTDGYGCLSAETKQVLVMHDLAYEHFTDHVPFLTRLYYRYFMPRFAKKAARIATVSEFSKNDIVVKYQIARNNIDVVYNGSKEVYKPIEEPKKQEIKSLYSGGKNYFIYVGSIHPRKNIKNLLLAFEKFKKETNSDYKLLLVGRKAWDFEEVEETLNKLSHKSDIEFLGHLPPKDLGELMASAFCMVYVSLFEGFGIPIIEAMSCGVPVVTSNVTSMPEASGDAALLVNPISFEEIANAMSEFYSNDALRATLIQKGFEQSKKFGWDKTAQKLWQTCEHVLDER
jgi:glycosyltransferase involved in cell wall biosynthesis